MFAHGTTRDGHPLLEIHYLSRLGDDIENWAIFEGSEQHDATTDEIVGDDPDLVTALAVLGLAIAST